MIDKKSFKKAIARPLEKANFIKKGQSWYLDGDDAIVVFSLQKSDWNDEYFINIGIWLKALGKAEFPQENDCHLSYRAERLFPTEQELIREGASLEKGDMEILNRLSEFIGTRFIPFLRECTKVNKLRELMANGTLRHGFIRKDAKLYLTSY